ncbi:MAG: hypothetical protein ABF913_04865 [Oenococcus sp.]|uniref:hypothetical protein n=1 Tax=Oenococcus sp. TaxID=1979414 RepID=UPI0039E7BF3A
METERKIKELQLQKRGVETSQMILNRSGHYDEALKLEPIIDRYRTQINELKYPKRGACHV